MSSFGVDTQDLRPALKPKNKVGTLQTANGASSSFVSPNQFAVLSDSESDTEDISVPPQPNSRKSRIPHIVIYSYLINHSATLKKVNKKLATPVDVKSKSQLLLPCTKTVTDYNMIFDEIQTAKLAYHTYPLPDAIQQRVVLKGITPNVSVDEIRTTRADSPRITGCEDVPYHEDR
jgi:hypothetical protein